MNNDKQGGGVLYYAGLDVGLKSTCICVVDSNGKEVHACEVASDAEVIHSKLASLKVDYQRVGLETGQLSIHLTKTLRKLGLPAVCMDARQARAKGFLMVASSPLTRSSYHAGDDFAVMKAAREAAI